MRTAELAEPPRRRAPAALLRHDLLTAAGTLRALGAGAATSVTEAYGGVGGGYVRAYPRRVGTVTLTAQHPTLGTAAGSLEVVPTQTEWI